MKKNLHTLWLLLLLLGAGPAQAQFQFPIPDGHFTKWTTKTETPNGVSVTYDVIDDPFWNSLNMIAGLPPEMFTGPITMFKDEGRSGAEGDFAPKMRSNWMKFGSGDKEREIFLPGVIGCLDVLVDEQSAAFGRAFPCRPKSLKGWMKYNPVEGDSASIFVEVYKWRSDLNRRVIIGRVEKHYTGALEDWTEFDLPIKYTDENNPQVPDSICVLFVSSAGYNFDDLFECKGQVGSTLWVDDVEFVYEGQANERFSALASATLKPNPSATGMFQVKVPEVCRMDVVSLSGKVLMSRQLGAGVNMLNLSAAAKGIYMVRLTNARGTAVLKAVRP